MKEYIVIFNEDEKGIARSWHTRGEIVKCKNCKYFEKDARGGLCRYNKAWFPDDGWCCYGVTKNSILEYKGYHTRIEYDKEGMCLVGKIEGIDDLVTFEAEKAHDVEKVFHEAVDSYLDFCKEVGKRK